MNWYTFFKISQETGLWGQNIAQDKPLNDQGNRTLFDVSSIPDPPVYLYSGNGILEDLENRARNCEDVDYLIDKYNTLYSFVKWEGGAAPVYVIQENEIYVIECDQNAVYVQEANDWVNNITDFDLDLYFSIPDFNQEFWDGVGENTKVYHATSSENIPSILENGLFAKSETRGMSNRFMDDAVFTSINPESISSYGDSIIEINVSAMKASGFMPRVSEEDPLREDRQREAIAHKIGLEDFYVESRSWEGLDQDTIAFYGNIPPMFLKQIS